MNVNPRMEYDLVDQGPFMFLLKLFTLYPGIGPFIVMCNHVMFFPPAVPDRARQYHSHYSAPQLSCSSPGSLTHAGGHHVRVLWHKVL